MQMLERSLGYTPLPARTRARTRVHVHSRVLKHSKHTGTYRGAHRLSLNRLSVHCRFSHCCTALGEASAL
jgi:hypothetical protein